MYDVVLQCDSVQHKNTIFHFSFNYANSLATSFLQFQICDIYKEAATLIYSHTGTIGNKVRPARKARKTGLSMAFHISH